MSRVIVSTAAAPASPLFSQGVRVGDTLYVSGMVGVDTSTGELSGPGIQAQTRQAIRNCEAVVRTAGGSLADVAQVTVLLAHPEDFAGMNEAYAAAFPADPPTRAVGRLGPELPGVLVSVLMTAHLAG